MLTVEWLGVDNFDSNAGMCGKECMHIIMLPSQDNNSDMLGD
jgi:hypothetical protein